MKRISAFNKMKVFSLLLAALLLSAALMSCKGGSEPTEMERVQSLLGAEYSGATVNVTTARTGETLTSSYKLTKDGDGVKVNYSIQTLAEFNVTDGVIEAPTGDRVRLSVGEARVVGTQVAHLSGDPCPYDLSGVAIPSFTVNEKTVGVSSMDQASFELTLIDPDGFFGTDVGELSGISVSGNYSGELLNRLFISGTDPNGSYVKLEIAFD